MTKTVLLSGKITKRNGRVVESTVKAYGYLSVVASCIPWGKKITPETLGL